MVLDFATKKTVRKIFKRYLDNKKYINDTTVDIIYQTGAGEVPPGTKTGTSDKVLNAVIQIEQQAQKAFIEIKAVEDTKRHFEGTKQELIIDQLYFKGYKENVRAAATRAEITTSYAYLLLDEIIIYCYLRLKEYNYFKEVTQSAKD